MELLLLLARGLVLVLMYAFLLVLVFTLMADARAARPAARNTPAPVPGTPPAPAPAAPAPSVTRLEVQGGTQPVTGRNYSLYGPLEIGRGTTCDISIPNRFVSTHHARIVPENGAWVLEDLGSTNGTLVNGEPLDSPYPLKPGDRVMVGDTEFIVQ
ncbi:MAG: FHA domain-containing protein [Armatimonadota bacterium]